MPIPPPPIRTGDVETDLESLYQYIAQISVLEGVQITLAGTLDGQQVQDSGDAETTGSLLVHFRVDVANGATGTAVDIVVDHTIRVIFAWVLKTDADADAGDAIEIRNGANAISNQMPLPRDTEISIMDSVDDAQHRIAAGGTLRIHRINGGGGAADQRCTVHIVAIRVS